MASLTAPPDAFVPVTRQPAARWAWPALFCVLVVAALAIGWVGYTASDDAAYYAAAIGWLSHPPQAGQDHWGTRFPLILSLAGMMAAFGKGRLAMNLTALLWYAVFLFAVRGLATRIAGGRAGWIAAMLMATMPVVIANATTVSCDLTEATFLILGVWWAGDVAAGDARAWKPFAAGLAFGGAILCRETTALALFGFAPLFLIGRPIPRRALILMGVGCLALLGAEALYQWALTGDPLHRWALAFNHDSHIDRAANLEGNFLLWPPIDPLLVLLVNDDFALIFWLAIAAVGFGFHRRLDAAGPRRMLVLAACAGSTFLLVGALYTELVLNPRYFMLPAIAAAVAVAAWLDGMPPVRRAVLLALAIAAHFAMLSVENQHPRWPAEALLAAARAHPQTPIITDAETLHRAELPLGWSGLTNAQAGMPRAGALWVSEESAMPANARVIARYPSPPTFSGAVLQAIGLAPHLPASIAKRLIAPNPTMLLSAPR